MTELLPSGRTPWTVCGAAAALVWLFLTASVPANAGTYAWNSDGVDVSAGTADNWFPAGIPTNGDHIIFSGTASSDCDWNLDVEPASWTHELAYSNTVTIMTKYPGGGSFTQLTINGDCVISNGTLTHLANTGNTLEHDRLALRIDGDLTVGPPGAINADAKGFAPTRGPAAGGSGQSSTGAGHGGLAAAGVGWVSPGTTYGSVFSPTNLGSGAKRVGGGAVVLTVSRTASIDGTISARGTGGYRHAGSAGGSVFLHADALVGNGVIDVSGGISWGNSGAGGGGRIAVILDTGTGFGNVAMRAFGNTGTTYPSAAGTIYLQAAGRTMGRGTLVVDNNGYRSEWETITMMPPQQAVNLDALAEVIVTNKGMLGITSNTTLSFANANLISGGKSNSYVVVRSTNLLTFPTPFCVSNYTLCLDVPVAEYANWTVASNGVLSHSSNYDSEQYKLSVALHGSLTIAEGGTIDLNAKGYYNNKGPAPAANGQNKPGASHGGRGGDASSYDNSTDCYGSVLSPVSLGSGGGRYTGSYDVRRGGGVANLDIDGTTTVDGVISAGQRPNLGPLYRCAGAAGGSVSLRTQRLEGRGLLDVSGGDTESNTGAGAGGRISVVLTASDSFDAVTMRAHGGNAANGNRGSAGTIYIETATRTTGCGNVIVDNEPVEGGATTNVYVQLPPALDTPDGELTHATLVLTNGAHVALTTNITMQDLYIRTNTPTRLLLKGWILSLNTLYHDDWGLTNNVIYDGGEIIWALPPAGTVVTVR